MRAIPLFINPPAAPSLQDAIPGLAKSGLFALRALKIDAPLLPSLLDARPCVCVFSIPEEMPLNPLIALLEDLQALRQERGGPLRDGMLRIILIVYDRQIPMAVWSKAGVHEVIKAPIYVNSMVFKISAHHHKALAAEQRQMQAGPIKTHPLEAASSAAGDSDWRVYREKSPPLTEGSEKGVQKIEIVAELPIGGGGKWVPAPSSRDGGEDSLEPTWQYLPADGEAEPVPAPWTFRGDPPVYQPEQRAWKLSGTRPELRAGTAPTPSASGRGEASSAGKVLLSCVAGVPPPRLELRVRPEIQVRSVQRATYTERSEAESSGAAEESLPETSAVGDPGERAPREPRAITTESPRSKAEATSGTEGGRNSAFPETARPGDREDARASGATERRASSDATSPNRANLPKAREGDGPAGPGHADRRAESGGRESNPPHSDEATSSQSESRETRTSRSSTARADAAEHVARLPPSAGGGESSAAGALTSQSRAAGSSGPGAAETRPRAREDAGGPESDRQRDSTSSDESARSDKRGPNDRPPGDAAPMDWLDARASAERAETANRQASETKGSSLASELGAPERSPPDANSHAARSADEEPPSARAPDSPTTDPSQQPRAATEIEAARRDLRRPEATQNSWSRQVGEDEDPRRRRRRSEENAANEREGRADADEDETAWQNAAQARLASLSAERVGTPAIPSESAQASHASASQEARTDAERGAWVAFWEYCKKLLGLG